MKSQGFYLSREHIDSVALSAKNTDLICIHYYDPPASVMPRALSYDAVALT